MPSDNVITIQPDGTLRFIWSDELRPILALGRGSIERASHVESNDANQWEADLSPVGGPVLGPFDNRSDALAAEIEWLQSHGY
jgi:hypothetical protein